MSKESFNIDTIDTYAFIRSLEYYILTSDGPLKNSEILRIAGIIDLNSNITGEV